MAAQGFIDIIDFDCPPQIGTGVVILVYSDYHPNHEVALGSDLAHAARRLRNVIEARRKLLEQMELNVEVRVHHVARKVMMPASKRLESEGRWFLLCAGCGERLAIVTCYCTDCTSARDGRVPSAHSVLSFGDESEWPMEISPEPGYTQDEHPSYPQGVWWRMAPRDYVKRPRGDDLRRAIRKSDSVAKERFDWVKPRDGFDIPEQEARFPLNLWARWIPEDKRESLANQVAYRLQQMRSDGDKERLKREILNNYSPPDYYRQIKPNRPGGMFEWQLLVCYKKNCETWHLIP